MKIRTIKDYSEDLRIHNDNPHELSQLGCEIAGHYGLIMSEYALYKQKFLAFYMEHKDAKDDKGKKPTDTYIKAMWHITEDGERHMKLSYARKSLEMMFRACTNATFVANKHYQQMEEENKF